MRSVLYITYDGLTDPLGQSQILAYLKRLGKNNSIVILSFEKKELYTKEGKTMKQIIDTSNLIWVPVSYTRKPPIFSTMLDIRKGLRLAQQLHKQHKFQIVHCRGYISAIIGRRLKAKFNLKFIFDMRGWWADEKKESGYWDSKIYQPVYCYFKKLERKFFREADYSVSLTYKGKEEIERQKLATPEKVGVIPTCVDFEIFKPFDEQVRQSIRKELGVYDHEKVFVYSGSLGGNYDPHILINVFQAYRKVHPQSFLLILSKDQLDEHLSALFKSEKIDRIKILNLPFMRVTNYLRASDIGFVYYKMSFSTIGRSPTKMGEYWASGVPVISFQGIGDLDIIIPKYPGSGVLLSDKTAHWELQFKSSQFASREQLRSFSEDYFHIDKGAEFYEAVYEKLVPF